MGSNVRKSFHSDTLAGEEPAFCREVNGSHGITMIGEALDFFKRQHSSRSLLWEGGNSAMESRASSKLQRCSTPQ